MVYTLATTFGINPVEVYNMPAKLAKEMLDIHIVTKEIEAEELEKMQRKGL